MVVLRLFASAREAAKTGRIEIPGGTVKEVLDEARRRFGPLFEQILDNSQVWLNGEPTKDDESVEAGDEIAVLPPISGGL